MTTFRGKHTSALSRRRLVTAAAASVTLVPLAALQFRTAQGESARGRGFGPLTAKLPENAAELPLDLRNMALLSVPAAFEYSVISFAGARLNDGNPVPPGHDGMGAFSGPRGTTVLVRNHELSTGGIAVAAPSATYDRAVSGGTTTLIVDANGRLLDHRGSLAGTERNCCGGPTPWKSWLTCEEAFTTRDGVRHGYVFEVPAGRASDAVPLKGLGRFNHEAAAVDPATGDVYLTEDRPDSLFYRFRPAARGDLRSPGKLEALRLRDWPKGVHTGAGFSNKALAPLAADWVPIDDFDPAKDTTRAEGASKGAARFSRGEGLGYGAGRVYFSCTDGGDAGRGQIFVYDPAKSSLTLFVESKNSAALDAPDNLVVGPDGRLYVCEDGAGSDRVVGIQQNGELFSVIQNNFNPAEFAGACFSPDGKFLFLNSQAPGLTYVVRGPWRAS